MDINKSGTATRRSCALAVALAVVLLISALSAAPALAAKGGPDRATGSERCWADPNPVDDGQQLKIFGSGFKTGQSLIIFVGEGGILLTSTDSLGFFSAWEWAAFRDPATITVKVVRSGDRHKTVLATCSFQANGSPR